MQLNDFDKAILDGAHGQATRKAMDLIMRYAGVRWGPSGCAGSPGPICFAVPTTIMHHREGLTPEAATIDQARITVISADVADSIDQLNGHDRKRVDYISLEGHHGDSLF